MILIKSMVHCYETLSYIAQRYVISCLNFVIFLRKTAFLLMSRAHEMRFLP